MAVFDKLFRKWKPKDSKRKLIRAWKKDGNKIGLLYFYCHANGTRLSFGLDDEISTSDLRLELKREGASLENPPCLVFLNGCHTAVGESTGGFLAATGGQGFCGFIGTEAKIPDLFAMRFGLALLHELFTRDLPVRDIMQELHRKHWPLSIVIT